MTKLKKLYCSGFLCIMSDDNIKNLALTYIDATDNTRGNNVMH